MKGKNSWACFLMILAGIVIGGFIGKLIPVAWLNYGREFGLASPLELDLGILSISFGLSIDITVASILGIVIAIVLYKML